MALCQTLGEKHVAGVSLAKDPAGTKTQDSTSDQTVNFENIAPPEPDGLSQSPEIDTENLPILEDAEEQSLYWYYGNLRVIP